LAIHFTSTAARSVDHHPLLWISGLSAKPRRQCRRWDRRASVFRRPGLRRRSVEVQTGRDTLDRQNADDFWTGGAYRSRG